MGVPPAMSNSSVPGGGLVPATGPTSTGAASGAASGSPGAAPGTEPGFPSGAVGDGETADVIVVGAGPAGSCAAYHLARHGLDVLLLEKSSFPREKVCGDGLTPRAVRHLVRMGVDVSAEGWQRNRGLRYVSGDLRLEVDWPDSGHFPGFGLTRTRHDFDEILARRAAAAGARLHTGVRVMEPIRNRAGRVTGVRALAGADREPVGFTAPVVIAADGASGRLALALGIERRVDRPLGVAVRRYVHSPAMHADTHLEIWLDVRDGRSGALLPGYGWVFPLGDGRVNVGLGVLDQNKATGDATALRRMLSQWLRNTPAAWGLNDERNADGPVRGAGLPMGFARTPHYRSGLLLAGDAGGLVNPGNGEGIAYAMESGELAAECAAQARSRTKAPQRERALRWYAHELHRRHASYYRLATNLSALLTRPAFRTVLNRHAVRSPAAMGALTRVLANIAVDHGGDVVDHTINTVLRAVPPLSPRRR